MQDDRRMECGQVEKHDRSVYGPTAPTVQEQSEFLVLLKKLEPVQRDAVIAFIKAMLED